MKYYNIIIENKELSDFNPVMFGCDSVGPGYSLKTLRDYYLVHYVVSGEGDIQTDGQTHHVKDGQIFLIKKGQLAYYQASYTNPWTYIWIGFMGNLAERFKQLNTVTDYNSNLFIDMLAVKDMDSLREEFLAGKLFQLYTDLFMTHTISKYSTRIKNFIDTNYMLKISVDELAGTLNLNRQYLSRAFKKETGISIQQYLIRTRINKASELLHKGFSVSETAALIGYDDQFAFSKMYKKCTGVSPSKARSEKRSTTAKERH